MSSVFAAAGLAEAAWAEDACMLFFALGLVGVVTLFALSLRSKRLAITAAVLLLFVTVGPSRKPLTLTRTCSRLQVCSGKWGWFGWLSALASSVPWCWRSCHRKRVCPH
jgi:hypothetical protein